MKFFLTLLMLFTLTPVYGFYSDTLDYHLSEVMEEGVRQGIPGIMLSYSYGNGPVQTLTLGVSDKATQKALMPSDKTRIGAVSMMFMSALFLQLQEEGRLSLDDSLSTVIDPMETSFLSKNDPSFREILGHRSGFPDYTGIFYELLPNGAKKWSMDDVLVFAQREKGVTESQVTFSFVHTNYVILGKTIEAIFRRPVGEILKDKLLKPNKLNNTFLANDEDIPGNIMSGYKTLHREEINWNNVNQGYGLPDAGMVSTTEDLVEFLRELFIFRSVLSDDSLNQMLDDKTRHDYGLGVTNFRREGLRLYGHAGALNGYITYAYYFPEYDITYALAMNSTDEALANVVDLVLLEVEDVLIEGF